MFFSFSFPTYIFSILFNLIYFISDCILCKIHFRILELTNIKSLKIINNIKLLKKEKPWTISIFQLNSQS